MCNPKASQEEIGQAGLRLFVILYGGKQHDSLNGLRYVKFMEMVSSCKTFIDPEVPAYRESSIFPCVQGSLTAWKLHVIIWGNLGGTAINLDPREWGWELYTVRYILYANHHRSRRSARSLLKFIRCKCKFSLGEKSLWMQTCYCLWRLQQVKELSEFRTNGTNSRW